MADSHHHRSSLKQQNKTFKGGSNSTKRAVKRANRGKVATERSFGSTASDNSGRAERLNAARQVRELKKGESLKAKRGIDGQPPPPRVVVVLPITKNAASSSVKTLLVASSRGTRNTDEMMDSVDSGPVTVEFAQVHQRVTVVESPRDILPFLDLMMAADVLAVTFDATEKVDAVGDLLLAAARNFSMPTLILGYVENLDAVPAPKRLAVLKSWQEQIEALTGRDVKLVAKKEETQQMVRFLCNSKLGSRTTWQQRSIVLAETVSILPPAEEAAAASAGSAPEGEEPKVTLAVSGYLRGRALSPNQLIHIPAHGTFQIEKITVHQDPCPLVGRGRAMAEDDGAESTLLPDPNDQVPLLRVQGSGAGGWGGCTATSPCSCWRLLFCGHACGVQDE